jgi:hypothetical protein
MIVAMIRGKNLKVGDIVTNWESATILKLTVEPPPSVVVCAETTKGRFCCGKQAQMTITNAGESL